MKMNDARLSTRCKNQHIQVFVRVRPINEAEKKGKFAAIVDVPSNKEVMVHGRPQDRLSKKFTFNRVFGPLSKQIDVYNAVISPLVEEVLAGYNCTVFAYGQTGTGKTFTMEGVSNDPTQHWQSDTTAGMVPRALSHLFDDLRLLEAQEYTVRVSFLELYNEELFDLLSANDDVSKIRLYEDTARKGAVIIHGLEEVTVHNETEVYKILEKGSEKRQTAATLMNAHSSRSHTIFSVTVHIKENAVDGEELLKTGKLNLVDLAGSENVGRSGAVDRRAREAGNINQSLLTLGRVITALVERTPHIPYRESKLTRLLQESLGGRTKTSIIATVSPASCNLEETLSTLDYAHRAKNITNRPEINQKLSKKALLKVYSEEIERLRRDLLATRQKDGVYLPHDNYNEMQSLIDCQTKEIEEKISHIKALEETIQDKEKICNELQMKHEMQTSELHETKSELHTVSHALRSTNERLKITEHERDEKKHLVEEHANTEKALLSQAQTLLNVADTATTDTQKLHDKIARKAQVEQKNQSLGEQFRGDIAQRFHDVEKDFILYTEDIKQFCTSVKRQVDAQRIPDDARLDLTNRHSSATNRLSKDVNVSYEDCRSWIESRMSRASGMSQNERQCLIGVFAQLTPKICRLVESETANALRSLNDHVAERLRKVSTYVNETINSICDSRFEDCERLRERVRDIKESVECIIKDQNDVVQKRRVFAQVMEGLFNQYDLLKKEEEEHYTNTINRFDFVNETCRTIESRAPEDYDKNVDMVGKFENDVQCDLRKMESNVTRGTEENAKLARTTTEGGKGLVDELQSTIKSSCDTLEKNDKRVKNNAMEMRQKMDEDKTEILSSIDDIHKTAEDTTVIQTVFVEDRQVEMSSSSDDIGKKLESKSSESSDWNERSVEALRKTQRQTDKFFVDDMARDVPTGTTPARKDFAYPRQFTVTSPHDRILHRFRGARQLSKNLDDEIEESQNSEN